MLRKVTLSVAFVAALSANPCYARDEIRSVGSSTVYPFITVAAEEFALNNTGQRTPIVESTGTGGGFKLFCSGDGEDTPDLANASRAIKESEIELCKKNGVDSITEIKFGYDGIVIAHSLSAEDVNLSRRDIFLALARKVPKNGEMVDNFYTKWNEINPDLPDLAIEVYGPPPTSGTRDAFVELIMDKGCEDVAEVTSIYPGEKDRHHVCGAVREDGKFIEAGENDNLIIQKLSNNPVAFGIFGYSYLEENSQIVKAAAIEGIEPSAENIYSGKYAVSRPLFVYVKNSHIGKIPGIKEFITELTSDAAIGETGYLVAKGLVPLHSTEKEKVRKTVEALQ